MVFDIGKITIYLDQLLNILANIPLRKIQFKFTKNINHKRFINYLLETKLAASLDI